MKLAALKLSAVLCAATLACGGDTTEPDPLVGTYIATEWTTTGASGQTNQILAGSTLTISLNAGGTTSGHLHVAASGQDPAFDADMGGTWSRNGNTVNFSQTADTFVRNMPFTVVANGSNWALVGNHAFSGTNVQLTLTRGGEI